MTRTPGSPGRASRTVRKAGQWLWTGIGRVLRLLLLPFVVVLRRPVAAFRFRLGLDGNPLRRRTDRWESAVMAVVVLVMTAATAAAALLAVLIWQGRWASHVHQEAARHVVSAVVTGAPAGSGSGLPQEAVAWHDAAGHTHTGIATFTRVRDKGEKVVVWIDAAQHPVTAPLSAGEVVFDSLGSAFTVEFCSLMLAVGGYTLARRRLDRTRYADWASEWQRFNKVAR